MKVTVTYGEPYRTEGFQGGGRYGLSQFTRRDYEANVAGKDFKNTSKAELQSAVRRYVRRLENEAGFVHVPVEFVFTPGPGVKPAAFACRIKSSHNGHGRCPGVDFPQEFEPKGTFAR
jgi:hypothetical protein